ncbi:AAA family ATPase [Streptomyces europaeiscabiei]|uniref:AAA family ATPase n=1 Tax=Streptomyces europaeiscabiei TaxID=146819 RepID=UPI0029B13179|nr:AAA family ATPase [Streptomyces europaeiscabiei]MDX2524094.1 AAA family ATPase [Streptomyces europaeiscabiei]MDX3779518.1 AAA family ATPase [Streptomyces europaeiscabiei]MDX3840779.1 AAA family ATPase [Streptomyces europaeiscabiei]MDX3864812.1 AAA family ATPase [Streptomyces europaeiscabiei]MDX3871008.1 AAA family ATPase [Streptomyces europaeiscabiei]
MRNFRTLTDTKLPLGPLTVMVGPNAAGKSNVLHALEFLGDVTRKGIEPALEERGGFDALAFRGGRSPMSKITIGVEGIWSDFASEEAPDGYELSVSQRRLPEPRHREHVLYRQERFTQHPRPNAESSAELTSTACVINSPSETGSEDVRVTVGRMVSALHQNQIVPWPEGGSSAQAISEVSHHLSRIRVFDPDVRAARRPSPISESGRHLKGDASNLADFLLGLQEHGDAWELLLEDIRSAVPQIRNIHMSLLPGSGLVEVELEENRLRGRTRLADASWGTVRALCMLAVIHDPEPPLLTCIEEIDHGLHPHVLSLLALRLREASTRGQFLVTTHSPVLVNDLEPEELIVCERLASGASHIPARSLEDIQRVVEKSEYEPLGDLWYSGALGGAL